MQLWRLVGLGTLIVALALLTAGCGSGEEAAAPPAEPAPAEPTPAEPAPAPAETASAEPPPPAPADPAEPPAAAASEPFPVGPLDEGVIYATSTFAIPFTLTATEGWRAPFPELPEGHNIKDGTSGTYGLTFFTGDQVIDPSLVPDPADPPESYAAVPAPATPEEFAQWLADHPQLEASEPTPTTLAGAEGFEVETVTKGYPISTVGCAACAPLFGPFGDGVSIYISEGGEKTRWYVLDVDGKTLVIGAWAKSPEEFDASTDELEGQLETIEFG